MVTKKKKETALAKPERKELSAPELVKQSLQSLAQWIGGPLVPETAAEKQRVVKSFKDLLEEMDKQLKEKVKALVKSAGEKVTDKGSMALRVGGEFLHIRPTRTGYDPKKFEAMLRGKGLNPETYMDQTISYSFNDVKAKVGAQSNAYTPAELEGCRYTESYAVMQPTKEKPTDE